MALLENLKKKLTKKKEEMSEQIQRGREKSRQMYDEKKRAQQDKLANAKPSAITTVRKHLAMGTKNPLDVMKDEYVRRKYEKEH